MDVKVLKLVTWAVLGCLLALGVFGLLHHSETLWPDQVTTPHNDPEGMRWALEKPDISGHRPMRLQVKDHQPVFEGDDLPEEAKVPVKLISVVQLKSDLRCFGWFLDERNAKKNYLSVGGIMTGGGGYPVEVKAFDQDDEGEWVAYVDFKDRMYELRVDEAARFAQKLKGRGTAFSNKLEANEGRVVGPDRYVIYGNFALLVQKNLASQMAALDIRSAKPYGINVKSIRDGSVLKKVGFEAGDTITHVNGQRLEDFMSAVPVYRDMTSKPLKEFSVKFKRGARLREKTFNIDYDGPR